MKYMVLFAILTIGSIIGCSNSGGPVSTENNTAPVIVSVTFVPDTIIAGESCLIQVEAVDSDGDKLSYEWESVGSMAGSGPKVIFSPGSCCAAPWIFITVKDGKGGVTDSAVHLPFLYDDLSDDE